MATCPFVGMLGGPGAAEGRIHPAPGSFVWVGCSNYCQRPRRERRDDRSGSGLRYGKQRIDTRARPCGIDSADERQETEFDHEQDGATNYVVPDLGPEGFVESEVAQLSIEGSYSSSKLAPQSTSAALDTLEV